MHADPGRTMERCTGTRAATTPRKLPNASPGTKTRGRTRSITSLSTATGRRLSARHASAAVVEVRRRVDPVPAGRPLDRPWSDHDRREGAAELLAEDRGLWGGEAG